MKKRKSILAIYLIVSLALIVCSVVLALTVGINFGTDIAGGTQIEVQVQDINKVDAEIEKIEYASEIAIEHHLGLTCDPICGLVQIPCIERNAVAAMRAINAVSLASFLWDTRKISLDNVIQTMKETGIDMHKLYIYFCKPSLRGFLIT